MQQSIHKFKVDENGKKVSMMAAVPFVGKRTWDSKKLWNGLSGWARMVYMEE